MTPAQRSLLTYMYRGAVLFMNVFRGVGHFELRRGDVEIRRVQWTTAMACLNRGWIAKTMKDGEITGRFVITNMGKRAVTLARRADRKGRIDQAIDALYLASAQRRKWADDEPTRQLAEAFMAQHEACEARIRVLEERYGL